MQKKKIQGEIKNKTWKIHELDEFKKKIKDYENLKTQFHERVKFTCGVEFNTRYQTPTKQNKKYGKNMIYEISNLRR